MTARWVARTFWAALARNRIDAEEFQTQEGLERNLDKIVIFSLAVRFQNDIHHPDARQIYRKYLNNESLLGFTEAILDIEAGYSKNTPAHIRMFREVIVEELRGKGLGDTVIFGKK